MKKKRLYGIALFPLVITLSLAFLFFQKQSEPSLDSFNAGDIDHIDVIHGGKPIGALSTEDQELLMTYLQELELGKPDPNYWDYDGIIGQMFLLHMTNGDTINVAASSPFLIVDDVGYPCDYDICHAISRIFWRNVDAIRGE